MADESDTSPRTEPIEIRPVRLEDIEKINAFLEPVDFAVGTHNLRLYFENCDSPWRMATNTRGEIVGFCGNNILPLNDISFGFRVHIDEKYQGRGIMRRIGPDYYFPHPYMGNATPRGMEVLPQARKFDSKLVGYEGRPRVDVLRKLDWNGGKLAVQISLVRTEEDLRKVVAYDRESVLLLDRELFIRALCKESKPNSDDPYVKTLMAEVDGRTVGFGVIRRITDYYSLQPLYADSPEVAEQLLIELIRMFVEECGPEAELYFYILDSNYLMMRFLHEQKFKRCNCEVRQYSGGAEVIKEYCKFDRVYSLCDYWPV